MFTKGSCLSDIPDSFDNEFMYQYRYDSYDQTALLGPSGDRMTDPDTKLPGFQIAYTVDWTGSTIKNTKLQDDAQNQLKYPNAPLAETVLTLCTYHSTTAHSDKCPVIFASGTVRPMSAKTAYGRPWRMPPP